GRIVGPGAGCKRPRKLRAARHMSRPRSRRWRMSSVDPVTPAGAAPSASAGVSPETSTGTPTGGNGQSSDEVLVEIRHLKKYFPIQGGLLRRTIGHVYAVDDVNLEIRRGETLGL